MLSHYIQQQQRTKSNRSNCHVICVFWASILIHFIDQFKTQEGQETLAKVSQFSSVFNPWILCEFFALPYFVFRQTLPKEIIYTGLRFW